MKLMKTPSQWPSILVFAGLLAMLLGAIDPLEGSVVILPGSGVVALGAFLGQDRHRKLLGWASILVAVGVGAMFALSAEGGLGGTTGRPMWWGLAMLPYPVGWVMGLVGTLGKGRHRKLLYWALALVATGIAALVGLSMVEGGMTGHGRAVRLALSLIPYIVGLLIGLLAAILTLRDSLRERSS